MKINLSVSDYENGTLDIFFDVEIAENKELEEFISDLGYRTGNCEWFAFDSITINRKDLTKGESGGSF